MNYVAAGLRLFAQGEAVSGALSVVARHVDNAILWDKVGLYVAKSANSERSRRRHRADGTGPTAPGTRHTAPGRCMTCKMLFGPRGCVRRGARLGALPVHAIGPNAD